MNQLGFHGMSAKGFLDVAHVDMLSLGVVTADG